ncbi:MAG: alpha/beta hydrolase, partial [Planctomycetota bacterium]
LLPGHGTRPEDLEGVGADALARAARAHYEHLRSRYERVALVGFSMGGTLALILAAAPDLDAPAALVLVAPFLGVRHRWHHLLPVRVWVALLRPFIRWIGRPPELVRVNRPEGRAKVVCYGAFPTTAAGALLELRERAMEGTGPATLRMPTLLVFSRGDQVCSIAAMEEFFARIPAAAKRKVAFDRSDHHLLHDYEQRAAVDAICEFLGSP